jgi:hypothetical protein
MLNSNKIVCVTGDVGADFEIGDVTELTLIEDGVSCEYHMDSTYIKKLLTGEEWDKVIDAAKSEWSEWCRVMEWEIIDQEWDASMEALGKDDL